jgi:hypothetical protein
VADRDPLVRYLEQQRELGERELVLSTMSRASAVAGAGQAGSRELDQPASARKAGRPGAKTDAKRDAKAEGAVAESVPGWGSLPAVQDGQEPGAGGRERYRGSDVRGRGARRDRG